MISSGSFWQGAGQPAWVPVLIPSVPGIVGASLYAQGLIFEPVPAAGVPFGLTEALRLEIGS